MRLGPFDTSRINVRSSNDGGGGGGMGRAGGVGCGTLVIALIGALVFGLDPMQTIGVVEGVQQQVGAPQGGGAGGGRELSEQEVCTSSEYATEACNALTSLDATWQASFARAGRPFEQPFLNLFRSGVVRTEGCGSASSAVGPFYCPADKGIYIDTGFYDQLAQMSGTGGDFARLYVIAHEYGHHIQNITGLANQVRAAQQRNPAAANQLQVAMELQADCYAGLWAGKNRDLIEPGDLEEGLKAASAIGDDTLQRNAGQAINPEGFTHGTSRQRMAALRLGLDSPNDAACDVFFERA
ncbi:neutral zinc metallopeptidase [Porphyrobacter sp. ULC335]|uniref:KPN_02809 family neutral zinc metallopeptidase n=1 Tax=Porphyrobacter sp. ULC335 TaxID=2854260 RepID=UPI00221FDC22|nr:neutral zinc metallopeptidase [Porphyrobacter sp. ULC335]UYV14954.1 neutral zinc metallopeptidase [Porphyrobacter sp. ULC335]